MTAQRIADWLEGLGLGQYAEAFQAQQIDLAILSSLDEDDLLQLGVAAMGHRKRLRQAIAKLGATPPETAALRDLIPRMPTPIAMPLEEYLVESDPKLKLWAACDVVEDLLRLLVFLGVGELTRLSGELPDGLRRRLYQMIRTPTLGNWRRMAEEIACQVAETPPVESALPEPPASAVKTLAPFLDGSEGERKDPWRAFLALRNRFAHGGIGKAQSAKLLANWQPDFESL